MIFINSPKYRTDIDGLRAIAVLPVLLFHYGHLPNGYLGVDIFFVISGFLITGIIYKKIQNNSFSIIDFYIRRTRRIIPLVSFICLFSLIIGIITMLPDDLENLAQSVIATNFFSNNILQILTTKDYWDVVNEFKPLMHTWSLGIEEQYYLIYPFIFLLLGKKKKALILPTLIILTLISLALYFAPFSDYQKFYLLQFRFFELAIGGVAAILLNGKVIKHSFSLILLTLLLALIIFENSYISNQFEVILCVLLTTLILISENSNQKLLNNKVAIFVGRISFSLYMWHQVILAFSRYFLFKELTFEILTLLTIIIFILSYLSYEFIEQPFRDKKRISLKFVLTALISVFIITNAISFYIYQKAGVLKDIPELGIKKDDVERNMHAQYNDRIYQYDKDFTSEKNIKVLVIGNSFARDWANVLLESEYKSEIEISYIYSPQEHDKLKQRAKKAELIFISGTNVTFSEMGIKDSAKVWLVGTKNFGINNGIFYNYQGENYCSQRTALEKGYLESNEKLKSKWGNQYIDQITPILGSQNKVPVFTPDCNFISQDCRHYTSFGAKYMAKVLKYKLDQILNIEPSP